MNLDPRTQAAIFAAKISLTKLKAQYKSSANLHPNDAALRQVLEDAITSVELIPEEVARIQTQIDKTDDPEVREELEYQQWLVEQQLMRAHTAAKARLKYWLKIDTPEKQETELRKCRGNILHWFRQWAWTADPRPDSPLTDVPFMLFPFQEEFLEWLNNLVFDLRRDGMCDKSRDQGVSWMFLIWSVYQWLFSTKKRKFFALFGSRKEDFVDRLGDMSTLFEKMRFQLRLVPSWMLPAGFSEEHSNFCRILNPETDSTLIGESSNANFGRGGRYTVIFYDEHAAFPEGGFAAWTAASQSSKSKISISTPQGKQTKQAQLKYSSDIKKLTLHWKRHPWKTEVWYRMQKRSMSDVEIAQELDISYDASQPGRVFPGYDEKYHVLAWSDFARVFPESVEINQKTGEKRIRIPLHWSVGRSQDWGSTEGHPCVTVWLARAAENSAMPGAVFVYREYVAPTGSTPGQVARAIRELERRDNETERIARSGLSIMSHEAKSVRDTYVKEHGLVFDKWSTDYNAGIGQMLEYLEVRGKEDNPFRPELPGCPRLMLIADDEQARMERDFTLGHYYVTMPKDSKGLLRLRSEFPVYHYPPEEEGKAAQKMRPYKFFDDAMDTIRCAAATWFPSIKSLTREERIANALPVEFRIENIKNMTPEMQTAMLISRRAALQEAESKHPKPSTAWFSRARRQAAQQHFKVGRG